MGERGWGGGGEGGGEEYGEDREVEVVVVVGEGLEASRRVAELLLLS